MKPHRRLALFAAYSLIIPALLLPPLVLGWPGALPLAVRVAAFSAVWLLSALVVLASWPTVMDDSGDVSQDVTAAEVETTTRATDAPRVEIRRAEGIAIPA